MKRLIAGISIVLWTASLVAGEGPEKSAPAKPDRSFGTCIQWERTLDAAGKKATRDRKLVMVLAVAGNFEDPFFT